MPGPSSPCPSTRSPRVWSPGRVDTVLVVFTDMQGRLQGKRVHARYFLDEVAGHGMEGCNYLLAVDVEMNTVSGYEISSWEQGYGDFVITPDLGTLRLAPWLPSVGHGPVRPVVAGRHARSASRRARCCGPRSTRRSGSGSPPYGGHGAGVHRLRRLLPAGVRRELPGADRLDALQRRLLDPRHQRRRAADARHPQRDVRRRADGRVVQGRVQPRPARDRLQVRPRCCAPPTTTSCSRPRPRNSPTGTARR